jgi:uncharacterized protein YbjT (DUF2867 family)
VRKILVIGATGRVGRAVVTELVRADVPVRALTRRPEAAGLPPEVEVVSGDLTHPESLVAAVEGVSTVFLVWTAPAATVDAVIERLSGDTRRVVFLSSPHRTPHPFFQQPNPMAALHADIEDSIEHAGISATIVRPGMFASNARLWWQSMIRDKGVVRWPYGGVETAPIDERDLAAVAARVLCDVSHAGRDYVLTGPEALTPSQQVAIIADAIGRPLQYEELSPEEFRQETAGRWPPAVVEMLLAAWGAAVGHPAFVTQTVEEVTGSPARTFRQWTTDHSEAFRQEAAWTRRSSS